MIQIKDYNEITKDGISPEESVILAENILNLENLNLLGLMSIGPNTDDRSIVRRSFRNTAKTLDVINKKFNLSLKELSMGMSNDYTIAIEEGSTIIRLGTSIFGARL